MINALALNLIADVMGWDTEEATAQYGWLRLMSSVKYDGYSDFTAGVRFLENLATWLRQFDVVDRPAAYSFVRGRLVYVSQAEMQRVIEIFVPETVTPYLRRKVAAGAGIRPWEVWADAGGSAAFDSSLRRCLFIGLSDGSRIDILRRANSPRLVQDQFVPMLDIGEEKWIDLAEKLAKAEGADARFDDVYLIDDFTASGTTFVRRNHEGRWKGKLKKFNDLVVNAREQLADRFPIADCYVLHIHHYLSTAQARTALEDRVADARTNMTGRSFGEVLITEGSRLPVSLKMADAADAPMLDLCDRYYDDHLYQRLKEHCDEAGQTDMRRGYANCALPVALEHNTPNNALPLLWAETGGKLGPAMRPLFRRRDRHG